MTNEHLRLLLDDPCDLAILHKAQPVALPTLSCRSLCLPLCGLRQPNGCVRALVVGDVFRLVARALAQHYASAFQAA